MSLKQRWRILALSILLPLSVPLLAGGYWLWLNHWLFGWIAASAALALTWWSLSQILQKYRPEPTWLDISQSLTNTPQSSQAWQRVAAIAAEERIRSHDLGDSGFYLQSLTKVMHAVAEVYYPRQKQAILEIKIPYLLKVIEIFAQELRINFTENVPGSHVFSINDLAKGQRIAGKGRELYRLFRIVTAGFDPVSALIRELRVAANSRLLADSTGDLRRWLIDAYIKKVGYYAIELYSGNLTLEDDTFSQPTRKTQREIERIGEREKQRNAEPFRILILGKTNSGKGSLINALAERQLALAGTMPNPHDRQTYLLHRDDFPSTLIADSWRYHEQQSAKDHQALLRQAGKSDVAVFVVSAVDAAHQLDQAVIRQLRQLADGPRIVVAMTHIDQLRPIREWNPPYNWQAPASVKAEAIRHAMTHLAECLEVAIGQIVPLCLREGRVYNCREHLVSLILQQLELATQRKYLRSLNDYRREAKRRLLWRQMFRSGYWVSRLGRYLVTKQSRRAGRL